MNHSGQSGLYRFTVLGNIQHAVVCFISDICNKESFFTLNCGNLCIDVISNSLCGRHIVIGCPVIRNLSNNWAIQLDKISTVPNVKCEISCFNVNNTLDLVSLWQ